MLRLALLLICSFSLLLGDVHVSYGFSQGRTGDHLISYLHAKWIAYKNGYTLVYRPFKFSDQFTFHDVEPHYIKNNFKEIKVLSSLSELSRPQKNILYEIPYTPECRQEYDILPPIIKIFPYIEVDWDDQTFLNMIRPLLAPRVSLSLIPLPKDKVSVALHIRKGVGIDRKMGKSSIYAFKFLSDQFYIDQLRWIYNEMGQKPLYAFIFSNDPFPQKIAEKYKSILSDIDIEFDYRSFEGDPDNYLMSDFYSMTQFDCMIRPESNLSFVASKIGTQEIVISPLSIVKRTYPAIVDKVKIERRPKKAS